MGTAQTPLQVKLFVALLYDAGASPEDFIRNITDQFGPVDKPYGPVPFSFSAYYAEEMGSNLVKWYATFSTLIQRDRLAAIKIFTNTLEAAALAKGKRRFNADPGYLAPDKLVLASTKDFYHRICVGEGIYGEVTLHFRKGEFRHFSWTYPDYKEPAFLDFLTASRADYMQRIRR